MRPHNGHRRRLHQHDAVAGSSVLALVLAAARLRSSTSLRDALAADTLARR